MPLVGTIYRTRACPECKEINTHGTTCDNPSCLNYCGPLVAVALECVYADEVKPS